MKVVLEFQPGFCNFVGILFVGTLIYEWRAGIEIIPELFSGVPESFTVTA
jgi:hypothetical protein